jgi:TrmH family RNA methyltransferase
LLAEAHRDRVSVVLVRPRNPLNSGAAARAMANFGFAHLAVVAPYGPHWREARSAVGAPQLLQDARESATLSEAVGDCTLVAGTGTLDHRRPGQRAVKLPELTPIIAGEIARGGRIALVFGPEKHGLTRDDLSICHLLVEIPTHPGQPSMNLGQAVAVCLYELACGDGTVTAPASQDIPMPSRGEDDSAASSGELDRLAGVIEETMVASGYSPPAMRRANRLYLRELLRRLAFSQADARRALRLFRRILWRLGHR